MRTDDGREKGRATGGGRRDGGTSSALPPSIERLARIRWSTATQEEIEDFIAWHSEASANQVETFFRIQTAAYEEREAEARERKRRGEAAHGKASANASQVTLQEITARDLGLDVG